MKKLYTLLLSMLVCSMVSAQITLTVDGVKLGSVATYIKTYSQERVEDKVPGLPMLGQICGLYPTVMLKSEKTQDVIVTVIDNSENGGTRFCGLDGTCVPLDNNNNFRTTKTVKFTAGNAQDMLLDVQHDKPATSAYEVELQIDAYGTLDSQRCTVTVILKYDPSSADGVQVIVKDEASAPYYNLSGMRTQAAKKGIYIRNGRKVVK